MNYVCFYCSNIFDPLGIKPMDGPVAGNNPKGVTFGPTFWCPISTCGGPLREVDDFLADIIIKLKKFGLKTIYSCSGHLHKDTTFPHVTFLLSELGVAFVKKVLATMDVVNTSFEHVFEFKPAIDSDYWHQCEHEKRDKTRFTMAVEPEENLDFPKDDPEGRPQLYRLEMTRVFIEQLYTFYSLCLKQRDKEKREEKEKENDTQEN